MMTASSHTNCPQLSIIIPTYNRPHLLPRAVESALAQSFEAIEVIVVDDASPTPVNLPDYPKLTVIRLPQNKGGAAARNIGAQAAKGRWITYLDDDDELLPDMVARSLAALAETTLPPPVAVLSGIEVINTSGTVTQTRFPPTLPRGSRFHLESVDPKYSFSTKQTLVIEKEVLLQIGGFDESFPSRVHTELFLRLNPVCSLLGLPFVTYRLRAHEGTRISRNPNIRQVVFHQLIQKHSAAFRSSPKRFADFVYEHALRSYEMGQRWAALHHFLWAVRIHPRHIIGNLTWQFRKQWSK
jgi:glycosyltransferase involved in cell wall biosynthesis